MYTNTVKSTSREKHILYFFLKGTQLRSSRVIHVKRKFSKTYFLVTNVFGVSKLILWYLNMSSIDLATRFKTGMYLTLFRDHEFTRSQVLNVLPKDILIKVPQDILIYPTLVDKKKRVFEKFHVTRPDLYGVFFNGQSALF